MLNKARLRTYDFLRGLAILGVLTVHTSQYFPSDYIEFDIFFGMGRFGVQLFYLISALTMCYMWNQRLDENHPIINFYIRRFFRIAPLFWLAIVIYLSIQDWGPSYWAPDGISLSSIFLTAFFLHGFWPDSINSVVPGGWSIAIEMTFYLFFPVLISLIKTRATAYLLVGYLLFLFNILFFRDFISNFLYIYYVTTSTTIIKDFLYLNFINQSPVFLIGCFIYFNKDKPFTRYDFFIGIAWILSSIFFNIPMKEGIGFVTVYFFLAFFVICCIKFNITNYSLEILGKHSYAIYLSHFGVLELLRKIIPFNHWPLSFFLGLFSTIFLCILISLILHILVEKPIRKFVEKLTA
jgi:exopolysaccharide production protein ExoZ